MTVIVKPYAPMLNDTSQILLEISTLNSRHNNRESRLLRSELEMLIGCDKEKLFPRFAEHLVASGHCTHNLQSLWRALRCTCQRRELIGFSDING